MPHMSETELLAMGVLCLVLVTLYSILIVLPCWIIASRRNIAGGWWNWVIPLWNLYIAYSLGKGSLKNGFAIIVFFLIGVGAVAFQDQSPFYLAVGGISVFISFGMGCYVLYIWLRQMSILAGVHPQFLPVVMFVIPFLLALVAASLVSLKMISPTYANIYDNVISSFTWVVFMIVALRTPREELSEPDFVLGKE